MPMRVVFFCLIFLALRPVYSQPVRMESLMINGELPVFCDRSELESRFHIDSVLTRELYDNMTLTDSVLYIGESSFDYYRPDNSYYRGSKECMLSTAVFDDQIKSLDIGLFRISSQTSIKEIQALFPDFCAEPDDIQVYGDPRPYQYCRLETDSENYQLLIFFLEGKAVMVHLWQPG